MKKITKSVLGTALVLAALLQLTAAICPIEVSAAQSSSSIKQELKELEAEKKEIEKELASIRSQLSDNMDDIEDIVAQKNLIDQEVFLLYEQIGNINDQIASYSDLIADKQDELDQAQEHLSDLQVQNRERIRAMEKNGSLSYWSVIFKANSFADLLDRIRMIQEIAEADQRRMDEMSEAAQVVLEAKASLEEEKTALETNRQELEQSQLQLEEKRAEADALLAELVSKGDEYQALVDAAEAAAAEKDSEISKKEDEYDAAKDREYQQWLATQPKKEPTANTNTSGGGTAGTGSTVSGVTWLVPISYKAFTSAFGYRTHPVYGDRRFHYGVDLAADTGTPIVASRSGVVTRASYDGSSGYHVYIDHQDGFSTRYLHMTHYVVSAGDYVSAGQVIGYCGSTGTSTGPHLHFGVYLNDLAVNPALYINI